MPPLNDTLPRERSWDSFRSSDSLSSFVVAENTPSEVRKRRSYSGELELVVPVSAPAAPPRAPENDKPRPKPQRVRQRRSKWLIPADHPIKLTWDCLTILLSVASTYQTHASIRDRSFTESPFQILCKVWFAVDILLNFVTQHRTSNGVLREGRAVWARYLTTWFAVDVLSLFPWETLYVKPIIDMQNRRGFFKKSFFRTKAVIRVTRVLRGRHFKLFGQVARQTKHAGVGARRLLRLIIKYVPKYLLFLRNMKGALAVRTLRQVHWIRKFFNNVTSPTVKDDDTDTTDVMSDEWVEDNNVGLNIDDSADDNGDDDDEYDPSYYDDDPF